MRRLPVNKRLPDEVHKNSTAVDCVFTINLMERTVKKIIECSMAAALFGVAVYPAMAQSSVTVSGVIDTGLMSVSHVGDGTQSRLSAADSILGVSNVCFKSKEDLGNGLNAIFILQAGFTPSRG